MKKLNRKGFTLIELLAVIVIMAIILVVTVPNIINSISDARVNSIHNLAVSVANTYDTIAAQDLIAESKQLTGKAATATWTCISDAQATLLGLSTNDVKLASDENVADEYSEATKTTGCSAIRLNTTGGAEVLLVAQTGGKFAVSGANVYALSTEDAGHR